MALQYEAALVFFHFQEVFTLQMQTQAMKMLLEILIALCYNEIMMVVMMVYNFYRRLFARCSAKHCLI